MKLEILASKMQKKPEKSNKSSDLLDKLFGKTPDKDSEESTEEESTEVSLMKQFKQALDDSDFQTMSETLEEHYKLCEMNDRDDDQDLSLYEKDKPDMMDD